MTSANSEIVVNSLEDNMIDDEFTTLREAINQAVAGDTITFAPSLADSDGTILLNLGAFTLSKSLTIDASSVGGITLDAQGKSRVANIDASDVSFVELTFANGRVDCAGASQAVGGALLIEDANVSFVGCEFENNVVTAENFNPPDGFQNALKEYEFLNQNLHDATKRGFTGLRADGTRADLFAGFSVSNERERTSELNLPNQEKCDYRGIYGRDILRRTQRAHISIIS